jgi:WD repeat and SOF domain-containing protein 1
VEEVQAAAHCLPGALRSTRRALRARRRRGAQTRSNAIAWNPMEPMNLTLASEDCNLYTYDLRRLQAALCVHKARRLAGACPRARSALGRRGICG